MRLLLDTQALILWTIRPEGLPQRAQDAIAHEDVLISVVSLWEVTVKIGTVKLSFPLPITRVLEQDPFTLLPLALAHLVRLAELPLHHRDPFDRMLAAQALAEGVPIVTADPRIGVYGPQVLWG